MPTTEKLRKKLLNKLTELFQLDQPDLDFGFYRIMHAKAEQVQTFIDKDLLQIIEDSFGQVDGNRKIELQAKYEEVLREASEEYGIVEPENTPKAQKAKKDLDQLQDGATAEADVYDHLYRFFERYYDAGDFISRRYYTRENSGKAAPYAIPYNGEEVKLHWANADQYYVKTAEYFSNYTFDLAQAAEVRSLDEMSKDGFGVGDTPLKVHFRIVDAAEGEHGNIKASDDKKRSFVLYDKKPVEVNDVGELVVNFEYKPLPSGRNDVDEETAKELKKIYGTLNKGDQPNLAMAQKVLDALEHLEVISVYKNLLKLAAPTEKIKNRPLLAKYINQYTARNTSDYFIHKDLGSFLKRELDFYIKNEVMNLDDIENADAPAVESYLAKIKVIRKIATRLIEFLAQLENFQKKLWLKKKFVVDTNYCITLDRVPEELYVEIVENEAQHEEWVKLFAIDEIKGDLVTPAYSIPLTVDFLKINDKLVLDTCFFDDLFKAKLIESIDDLDEQCDGLLIHSENFQALNLLQKRYHEQVKCVYIDPPYNAKSSEIIYKNTFKHSSFLSFIHNRVIISKSLLDTSALINVAIDDYEHRGTLMVMDDIFLNENFIANVVVQHNPRGRNDDKFYGTSHEYMIVYAKDKNCASLGMFELSDKDKAIFNKIDDISLYHEVSFMRTGNNSDRKTRPNLFYPIYVDLNNQKYSLEPKEGYRKTFPINPGGEEKTWRWEKKTFLERCVTEVSARQKDGIIRLYKKRRLEGAGKKPKTIWYDSKYDASGSGIMYLRRILGKDNGFSYPKSISTVEDTLYISSNKDGIILDFFAGSGTTANAVINLNREDSGNRKYILVEMGDYFDTVVKPRISKVVYSTDWKDGKPTKRNTGNSHCFKYLRLESYEDTLNNLVFADNPVRDKVISENHPLRKDYMINYLLDVETRGSNSLLNIDEFADPTAYTLKVKKPGSDQQVNCTVDLIESFNYLIGLRLIHMAAPESYTASFTRKPDSELPKDQHTKLVISGKISKTQEGKWWFRKIDGWVPADPANPNNGQKENVLIIWRNLTGNQEEDNLMLDEWFKEYRKKTKDFEYDTIYVNGSNNLPNLKMVNENWKVLLIEEEFHKRMWEVAE